MSCQLNVWHRFELVPPEVDAATPRRVLKLGEHVGRTVTLSEDHWLVVCYKQNGDPEKYMVIQSPYKATTQGARHG